MITIPTALAVYFGIANLIVIIFSILTWNKITVDKAIRLKRFAKHIEERSYSKWESSQYNHDPVKEWEEELEYIENLREQIENKALCQRAKRYIEKLQTIENALRKDDSLSEEEKKALEKIRDMYYQVIEKELLKTRRQENIKKAKVRLADYIENSKQQRESKEKK